MECDLAIGWRERKSLIVPRKPKINLEKVKATLNTLCPKCGYAIPPVRIRRVDSEQIECPECGERFIPVKRC